MPGPANVIILSDLETASNPDILQGTRLQTVPDNGTLTFEIQSSEGDVTNNYVASVQMPGGDTPMNATRIPAGNGLNLEGVIDERTDLQASFRIAQGGHCVFSAVLTGAASLMWRVTYTPG